MAGEEQTRDVIVSDAYETGTVEEIACPHCRKVLTLHYNGGELDRKVCCGAEYFGEAKGFRIVARKLARNAPAAC